MESELYVNGLTLLERLYGKENLYLGLLLNAPARSSFNGKAAYDEYQDQGYHRVPYVENKIESPADILIYGIGVFDHPEVGQGELLLAVGGNIGGILLGKGSTIQLSV